MSNKPKERKSGWYVANEALPTQQIVAYVDNFGDNGCYFVDGSDEEFQESDFVTINEREIFDQLQQAQEMSEKIEEAKEIIKRLNVIIHALTHTDCPMLERKDIEDVVRAAKQFIK